MEAPVLDEARFAVPIACASGFVLSLVTSGGLLEERLSFGRETAGLVVNAVVTLASIAALVAAQRGTPVAGGVRTAQAAGAALGILAVHLALRLGLLEGAHWLAETPLQLVNDAVAVFAILGVVWACTLELSVWLFGCAILLVVLYRLTGRLWHLDRAPERFQSSIQDLVLRQFIGVFLGLLLFRAFTRKSPSRNP